MKKYLDDAGVKALEALLRSLCLTQKDGQAIYGVLEALADASEFPAAALSIPATGWKSSTSGPYKVYRDVSAASVTAADSVQVALAAGSMEAASACGLCPTVETLAGALRFRAVSAPKSALSGEYRILKGAQGG